MSLRTPQPIVPVATWEPKSGFFKHVMKKVRRPTVVQQAPSVHNAKLAFCTFHNTAYLSGDELPNSPCCDTPPLLTYDLEALTDAATVVEHLIDALGADSPVDLMNRIEVLAELVRVKVAGAADELSQEPSIAAGTGTPASEQDGLRTLPVASIEGSNGPAGADTPAALPGSEGVEGSLGGDAVSPRSPGKSRSRKAAAVAS